ncbi:MAG: hybrid sensor histidine kinase/response regulator [Panacagrimonas sp.]
MSDGAQSFRPAGADIGWVRGELQVSLRQAAQGVEQFAETPEIRAPLDDALQRLHEARGVLVMVQACGVALLVEEARQALLDISASRLGDVRSAAAAVIGGCLLAIDVIDLLQQGGDDCALLMQPAINELRIARGKPLATEEDLFVAHFGALSVTLAGPSTWPEGDARSEAARLSPAFSAALMTWFKDQDTARSLARMGRVAEIVSGHCRPPLLWQLWRTVAACVEALLSGTLDASLELKRQFGRAGQVLKTLAEAGEDAALKGLNDVSLRLLFHAGRSRGAGQRVAFLRSQLQLDLWLPSAERVQARRARLRGAGTQLLDTLLGEIRSDLAAVRDGLDVALRSDADAADFHAAGQRLRRVADTLSMLGLNEEAAVLGAPVEMLATPRATRESAVGWTRCAAAILQVEQSLEGALRRQFGGAEPLSMAATTPLPDELRSGISALLREALNNLKQVKMQAESGLLENNAAAITEAARLLDEIAGGLSILGLAPAADLVQRVQQVVLSGERPGERSGAAPPGRLPREFADALAAIEYFIERRLDGSPAAQPVLDRMARLLAETPVPDRPAKPVAAPAKPGRRPADADAPAVPADEDLRSVFIDEAAEVTAALSAALQRWRQNPDDRTALPDLRRGFHTLKGSGRTVHADGVAALARSIEALIQALIQASDEGTGPALEAVVDLVDRSIAALPALLAAFARGEPVPPEAAEIAALADRLAAKGSVDGRAETVPTDPPPDLDGEQAPTPELLAVFAPEALELLDALRDTANRWREVPASAMPGMTLQRDLHTFKGGARVAGLRSLGDAAHALETRLVELQHRGFEASADDVDDVARRIAHLRDTVEALLDRQPPAPRPHEPPETAEPSPVEPFEAAEKTSSATMGDGPAWDPQLFWQPPGDEAAGLEARREAVRVPVETLDTLLSQAGEMAVQRARLDESQALLRSTLAEVSATVTRLGEQMRHLEIENEAQIAAAHFAPGEGAHRYQGRFDPLEMDRYSRIQELSRSLGEGLGDLVSLHASLAGAASENEALHQQQARLEGELQQALMGTLTVAFSGAVPRLHRVVQQTAEQHGRAVRLEVTGAANGLDRNLLERITAPLEHLLRNAVVHGIEDAPVRSAAGKEPTGRITVALRRQDSHLLIEVADDGRGLDQAAIHAQAIARGLVTPGAALNEADLSRLVFTAGFSTAPALTQDAGRGIGLDVVAAEVRQLGGSVRAFSEPGRGLRVSLRLPLALAVSQCLVAQVGDELFALPLARIEGVMRVAREEAARLRAGTHGTLGHAGKDYAVHWLADWVGLPQAQVGGARSVPVILVKAGEGADRAIALLVDVLIGNRAIVSRASSPVLESVPGISGATQLPDGRVALILDLPELMQRHLQRGQGPSDPAPVPDAGPARRTVLVVDDSVTIRRVAERLLAREGYRTLTARDGLEAMAMMQAEAPDALLLDIEMPRADGFEVAAFVRHSPRLARLPIVMITSRSSDKHRQHAEQLAVDHYLTKPFQEDRLVQILRELLAGAGASPP